jgi:spermidine synthase
VGRLTGINTLAGVVGSLATGFAIIPLLGVSTGFLLVAGLYGAVALVAVWHASSTSWRIPAVAGVALLLVGVSSIRAWEIPPVRLRPGERLLSYHEGEGATVSVVEVQKSGEPVRLLKANSRYILARSTDASVHRSQGELPLRLHGTPRDVAFIGLATGTSVSSIQGFPSVERVLAMELIGGVVVAAEAFRDENGDVMNDPRVEVLLADGRNHLFGTDQRFDVVVGDLFVPWHAGTGYLYTVEHFESVRQRLTPGGVFAQWIQSDQVTLEELRIIARSFSDAFEDSELWLNVEHPGRPLIALVGRAPGGDKTTAHRTAETRFLRRIGGSESLRASAAVSHLARSPNELKRMLRALRSLR